MTCRGYFNGCTCGRCQERYIIEHANSCTYGSALAAVLRRDERNAAR